jgi:hypothetical protein
MGGSQPWSKEDFDVSAASRGFEAGLHPLVGDNQQRRGCHDPESVCEIGSFPDLDPVDDECFVVAAALQHLRQEAICSA